MAKEEHLKNPLLSILMEPIVQCSGLLRLHWINLEVVLLNDNGVVVIEGVCCNTHPHDCLDQNPLGNGNVGVVILESLVHSEVHLIEKGLCSVDGHSGASCSREVACVIMSDAICKSKRNSKPTCGHAKAYGSMIH